MRRLLLLIVLLMFASAPLLASTTPTEKAADDAAQAELDSSPRDGNIPSYQLKPADLAKGAHLEHVHAVLHFTDEAWGILQLVLLLSFGIAGRMENIVVERFKSRWLQGFGFVFLLLAVTSILELPVAIYGHMLSVHYGLSVQSWRGWVFDHAKKFALAWSIGGLITMLLFFVIRKAPQRWWLVFWILLIPITIGSVFVEPYVIEPLFDKIEPLQQTQPDLVRRMEEVAQRGHMNIPPERMYLSRVSKKVTTLNAYVSGFGASKRVVVWDTTVQKASPDQVLFIFGHESGHYVLRHVLIAEILSIAGSLPLLYLTFLLMRWSIGRFGRSWGVTDPSQWGALVVLLLILGLLSLVTEPVESGMIRMREHDADVYGQEAIHGIVSDPQAVARGSFQVLGETSFDDPNPSQFIEWWTYSHPSIGRRAAFSAHYDPWAAGAAPKYFPKQ